MACGGQLTFDILDYSTDGPYFHPDTIVPQYSKLAHTFNSIVHYMKEPSFLPNEVGIVWNNDEKMVVFGFKGLSPFKKISNQELVYINGNHFIAVINKRKSPLSILNGR
jgi:hypothetical protein